MIPSCKVGEFSEIGHPCLTYDRSNESLPTVVNCFEQVASLQDFGAPGADLENILYLRTVADADRILQSVKKLQSDGGKVGHVCMLLAISLCFCISS